MSSENFHFEDEAYPGTTRPKNTAAHSSFARLCIQYSGGLIKTELQANLLLALLSIILIVIALLHFQGSTPPLAPEHLRGVSTDELEAYRSVQPF